MNILYKKVRVFTFTSEHVYSSLFAKELNVWVQVGAGETFADTEETDTGISEVLNIFLTKKAT